MTTQAFRRGWQDGFDAAPSKEGSYVKGTFAQYDYLEGYRAGSCQAHPRRNSAAALIDHMLVAGRNPASRMWPDANPNVIEVEFGAYGRNRHG
jgi:hypothetical protein